MHTMIHGRSEVVDKFALCSVFGLKTVGYAIIRKVLVFSV